MVPEAFSGKPETWADQGRTRVTWDTVRAVDMKRHLALYAAVAVASGAGLAVVGDSNLLESILFVLVFTAVLLAVGSRFPRRTNDLQILSVEDPVAAESVTRVARQVAVDPRLIRTVRIDEVMRNKVRRRTGVQRGTRNSVVSYDLTVAGASGTDYVVATGFLESSHAVELQNLLMEHRDAAARADGQGASAPQDGPTDRELVLDIPPQPRWLIVVPCGFFASLILANIVVDLLAGGPVQPGDAIVGVIFLGLLTPCVTELRRRERLTVGGETIDAQVSGGLRGNKRRSIQRKDTASIGFAGAGGLAIDSRNRRFDARVTGNDGNLSRLARNLDMGTATRLHDALSRAGWPVTEIVVASSG